MIKCKFCNSTEIVKSSFTYQKQRYLCKKCNRKFTEGDSRRKYDDKIIEMAFLLFKEGNNYRRIARILSKLFDRKIPYQTVIKWIDRAVKNLPNISEESKKDKNLDSN
jgi:transposase-like protein